MQLPCSGRAAVVVSALSIVVLLCQPRPAAPVKAAEPDRSTPPPVGGDAIQFKIDRTALHGGGPAPAHLGPDERKALLALFDTLRTLGAGRPEVLFPSVGGAGAPPADGLDRLAWWRIDLPDRPGMSRAALQERCLARLRSCPIVLDMYVTPPLQPAVLPSGATDPAALRPGDDEPLCPIRTPLFDPLQKYLGPSPSGIWAPAAWSRPGGRGAGISFADIEGGWNRSHEDIPAERMEHVAGTIIRDRGWEAHGTAVVGVVGSPDNGLGMVGIATEVERIYTGSIGSIGAAAAIHLVSKRLKPGDVLLIELHGPGPRSRPGGGQKGFVPIEWWSAEFEAIRAATDRGIVVVEAAGNGAEDLDDPIYRQRFSRAYRDSGAIMVGAGAPPGPMVDRSRLEFSNHGSRIDLQGWGRCVATLDYGDLQRCSGVERYYTTAFSGTSSASPVVAGAVICLQGIHRARTGRTLTGRQLAGILGRTGSPQTDGPAGPATQRIGPRPDLSRALEELDRVSR